MEPARERGPPRGRMGEGTMANRPVTTKAQIKAARRYYEEPVRDGLTQFELDDGDFICSGCSCRRLREERRNRAGSKLCVYCDEMRRILNRYGLRLSVRDVEALKRGEIKCHACGTRSAANVEHCHGCGLVRGLVCSPCNLAEGKLGDESCKGSLIGTLALARYLALAHGWKAVAAHVESALRDLGAMPDPFALS